MNILLFDQLRHVLVNKNGTSLVRETGSTPTGQGQTERPRRVTGRQPEPISQC